VSEVQTIEDVVRVFREHLDLPDPGIVYVTLGTVAANHLPGEPVWTMLIAPPSSGKSEILSSLRKLPNYCAVSTFSEAGLLDRYGGGLLTELPNPGLMVFSDFNTMLTRHRGTRDAGFGALLEVYDGHFARRLAFGPDPWEGKVGLLAGVTEIIDDCDLGKLGERFCRYRLPERYDEDVHRMTTLFLDGVHDHPAHRARRADAVKELFDAVMPVAEPPALSQDERTRLGTLAGLGARCRSPVIRDAFKGDVIERVPQPEGPTRLLGVLVLLVAGMRVLGTPEARVWRLAAKVALDGMHPLRRRVLVILLCAPGSLSTAEVAARCSVPTTSVRRKLEDLAAHDIVTPYGYGQELWIVSPWTLDHWWSVGGV
jgi:hypothetical protein